MVLQSLGLILGKKNFLNNGLYAFNDLRREVVVCFVEIDGIVDHHCLNFLFIIININNKCGLFCIQWFEVKDDCSLC
jgi:hypothetical protein